ncbi:MAG: ABC transporter permease [Armatimonadota bacterium]|nr:ABC transporter permease [Armatimonadota bacterium]MDR7573949.1 ABC transporter permease [Armatimonadota bacterium]
MAQAETVLRPPPSLPAPRWARVRRAPTLLVGTALLAIIVAAAAAAPVLTPYSASALDLRRTFEGPSRAHPLGTDNFGRDLLARLLYGARIDLMIGVFATAVTLVVGSALGLLAGYYGGRLDRLIMRIVDVVVAFPFFVLVIGLVAMLGTGLRNMFVAIWLVGWVSYARIVRGEVLFVRTREYIEAARAIGLPDQRIIFRHVLPNAITPAIIFSMTDVVLNILLGSSLSFLGLGAQPPAPEWGLMIAEGRTFLATAWWMSALPGLAIVITGVAFSLIGDGLADVLRPGG